MAPKKDDINKTSDSKNTNEENKIITIKDIISNLPDGDEGRVDISKTIDDEIKAMIEEEIKNAAQELVEEQKMVIRAAVEENKKIIREVLEQEIAAIRAKEDHIRGSLLNYRTGRY